MLRSDARRAWKVQTIRAGRGAWHAAMPFEQDIRANNVVNTFFHRFVMRFLARGSMTSS
jgi:hypothetical protein